VRLTIQGRLLLTEIRSWRNAIWSARMLLFVEQQIM